MSYRSTIDLMSNDLYKYLTDDYIKLKKNTSWDHRRGIITDGIPVEYICYLTKTQIFANKTVLCDVLVTTNNILKYHGSQFSIQIQIPERLDSHNLLTMIYFNQNKSY